MNARAPAEERHEGPGQAPIPVGAARFLLLCLTGWVLGGFPAGRIDALAAVAGTEARASGNLAPRLLEMEAQVIEVTLEQRRKCVEMIDAAVAEIGRLKGRPAGHWDRRHALAVLRAIDTTLIRLGFVHPADGSVDLLAEALTPFRMSAADRGGFESRPENVRRAEMIAKRFPGPFHAADCDTAAFIYLGVAERLGLPLRLVLIPSRNREPGHAFIRWHEGNRRVDWETTQGRERLAGEAGGDRRASPARGDATEVLLELTASEVPGCGHYLVSVQHERRGDGVAALRDLAAAIRLCPGHLDALRRFAWNTATLANLPERDLDAAIRHARQVLARCRDADARDTLAAAYAASGRFDEAVREEKAAIADSEAEDAARAGYRRRLGLYQQGKAYHRDPIPPRLPASRTIP